MRLPVIAALLFALSFTVPHFASAQSTCLNEGDRCTINGLSGTCRSNPNCFGATNSTCDANICVANPGQCTSAGSSCTVNGTPGTCTYLDSDPSTPVCVANTSTPNNSGPQVTPNNPGPSVGLINPLKSGTSLSGFLDNILNFVIEIGTIVIILMIVYVGFMFVTAQGSDSKLTTARQALLWTVIGALILLGAKAIALGIESTVKALGG